MHVTEAPADDTPVYTAFPGGPIPGLGGTGTLRISNETGSGIGGNSSVSTVEGVTRTDAELFGSGSISFTGSLVNEREIVFPELLADIIDAEDEPDHEITTTTNFGNSVVDTVTQEARDRDDSPATTTLTVVYSGLNIPGTTVTVNSTSSSSITSVFNETAGTLTWTRVDYPGRLDSTEVSVSSLGSLINFNPTSEFFEFKPFPEEEGEVVFTANTSTSINGQKRWEIPNTRGKFFGGPRDLWQDGFRGLTSGGTFQNNHFYNYHPKADSTVNIPVIGTGPTTAIPTIPLGTTQFQYNYPGVNNGKGIAYFILPVPDDGNPYLSTYFNTSEHNAYRVQLLYGNIMDTSTVGVFTDTGWIAGTSS